MRSGEVETLIVTYAALDRAWPQEPLRALARRLPYARRLALRAALACGDARRADTARASLAGIALAWHAVAAVEGVAVDSADARSWPSRLSFPQGGKPVLRASAVDFSISHCEGWVACAARARGAVGLDLEAGSGARERAWVRFEAKLKCRGQGLASVAVAPSGDAPQVHELALEPGLQAALALAPPAGAMHVEVRRLDPSQALTWWARAA